MTATGVLTSALGDEYALAGPWGSHPYAVRTTLHQLWVISQLGMGCRSVACGIGSHYMTDDEQTILLTAQDAAIAILGQARSRASQITSDAEAGALAIALEQQAAATKLLEEQREKIAGSDKTKADRAAVLAEYRKVAELLASSENEEAMKLRQAHAKEAVDVLMAGQREAAAVLLEAWMSVTEGRPSPGTS